MMTPDIVITEIWSKLNQQKDKHKYTRTNNINNILFIHSTLSINLTAWPWTLQKIKINKWINKRTNETNILIHIYSSIITTIITTINGGDSCQDTMVEIWRPIKIRVCMQVHFHIFEYEERKIMDKTVLRDRKQPAWLNPVEI